MNPATLPRITAAVETVQRAVTFRAWIENREIVGSEALANAETFEEALDAILPWASHKNNVSILRDDACHREKVLCIYTIKQESQRRWGRDPVTGVPTAFRRTYPALVVSLPVDAFEPTRPFDAFRDCPVGIDRQLVEVRHG